MCESEVEAAMPKITDAQQLQLHFKKAKVM